jgi:transglutaminase-like putative cysteine protease
MIFSVTHRMSYVYERPVFLAPQTIRLFPRLNSLTKLLDYECTVSPQPVGMSVNVESDGSLSRLVWFDHPTASFTVDIKMTLELSLHNPFNFIIHPMNCQKLPLHYPKDLEHEIAMYCVRDRPFLAVAKYSNEIMEKAHGDTVTFLTTLCRQINQDFAYQERELGEPYPAEKTLSLKQGSCRDLSVLFMEAARSVGFAARFVSGYYFDEAFSGPALHAWCEIYLPGAGWRGFDPTIGLVCEGRHVALAAAASAIMAAPVSGVFSGDSSAVMTTDLKFLKK